MDIENNLEMSGYSLMGGVPSLPSPGTHNKKGWHKAMLARDDFHPEDDDEYLKKIPEWTRGEIAITGLASGSVLTSTVALLIAVANPFIYVTAILGIVVPVYSAFQEKKITDCKAMRETNRSMAREMENLQFNNERLKDENAKLEGCVERIQNMKDVHKRCKKTGDKSLAQLEEQLKRSKNVLAQMETNRANETVDNIFDIMLAVDKDQDFSLSDYEIDEMALRLRGIMNVEVDVEGFKQKIVENGRDLDSIMILLRESLGENASESKEHKVIRILR